MELGSPNSNRNACQRIYLFRERTKHINNILNYRPVSLDDAKMLKKKQLKRFKFVTIEEHTYSCCMLS